jgi:hypothetical protein
MSVNRSNERRGRTNRLLPTSRSEALGRGTNRVGRSEFGDADGGADRLLSQRVTLAAWVRVPGYQPDAYRRPVGLACTLAAGMSDQLPD